MTLTERNTCYEKWSYSADLAMQIYEEERSEGAWITVVCISAALAALDRTHHRKLTQKIQEFVWEHAFLRNEVTYERYFKSGYFKEKYKV